MSAQNKISVTAGDLARLAKGRLEGDESYVLEGAQGLNEAGPKDVSFLGNPKYAQAAATSGAGCLFLPASAKDVPAKAPNKIYVEDPQYAFSLVLGLIAEKKAKILAVVDSRAVVDHAAQLSPGVGVGPFSVIARGAAIGQDTVIGAQCYIGENVRIGRGCKIYPQVVIREDCVVGDRAIIHAGTVIGADGFGFSTDMKTGRHRKIPQIGNVVIEEDVEIGANVAIDRATIGSTVIGAGSKIDNLVQIAHNVQIGRGCLLVGQSGVAGSSSLGDGVIIAGQAGVAGHLHVGERSIVMAQTGIMSDVEKGGVVFGTPSKPRREAFRLLALYGKLPELFEAVKEIKKKLGLGDNQDAPKVEAK